MSADSSERKPITKDEWQEFVRINCTSSYEFIVCQAILVLWEAQVENREEGDRVLMSEKLGLSGAQADFAISMALQRTPTGWLAQDALDIRINQKNETTAA